MIHLHVPLRLAPALLAFACSAPAASGVAPERPTQHAEAPARAPQPAQDAQDASESQPPQDEVWTQEELERVAREVQAQIEELRGEAFREPVKVEVATREKLEAYIVERSAMESPEKRTADETIAKLLGVLPPEIDLQQTAIDLFKVQVAGFYDPPSDTFYLMDTMPKALGRITMAHELVHALDDQLYDIDAKLEELEGNTDRVLAYHAVVEGSGMAGQALWLRQNMGEVDLGGVQELMDEQAASMADAPAYLWKPLLCAYFQGFAFLSRADSLMGAQMRPSDVADVRAAFEDVPRSMEQVLHSERYWDEAKRDEPREVQLGAGKLPEAWELLAEDTLGELYLALVVENDLGGLDVSNPAALFVLTFTSELTDGWGGDRVALLGSGDARYLELASVWDSPRDAAEFYGAATLMIPRMEKAAQALAPEDGRRRSGAELLYGERPDVVVLRVWSGVPSKDLKPLQRALELTVAPGP